MLEYEVLDTMFFLVFAVWIIFNGRFTVETAVIGIILSGLVVLFACKVLGYPIKKEIRVIRIIPRLISYFFYFLGQLIIANLTVMRFALSPKRKVKSVIVTFDTDIESQFFRTLLANSITLTPGTLTVSLNKGTYRVHCLDESFDVGIEASGFIRRISKMEAIVNGKKINKERNEAGKVSEEV
ncbi:MAG: Na+/H+ antiporter subunit E [Lachnospiraceae bacterium]|nr:Na+/H+ antiporter subunit E [Lachnospiraceae bacterium]